MNRESRMERNKFGLYDIEIRDESGRVIVIERNISMERAMSVIDKEMSAASYEPRRLL